MVEYFTLKARLQNLCNLVFFCILLSCSVDDNPQTIKVHYDDSKPVGITIPESLTDSEFEPDKLIVSLDIPSEPPVAILGSLSTSDSMFFKPLVPFTSGMQYAVIYKNETLGKFMIPENRGREVTVLSMYPTIDTVPSNLLKMYLEFSQPMGVDHSNKFITVLNDKGDSIKSVFLDLNPELWNQDRTILTLWLDPGRIKRGLIPNEIYGSPLEVETHYTIRVKPGWKSREGSFTEDIFTKHFFVSERDSISPKINAWNLTIPEPSTNQPLKVNFNEPMDFILAHETFHVIFAGNQIKGEIELSDKERVLTFLPNQIWLEGIYQIQVESRFEDLAGNNFTRLFETEKVENQEDEDELKKLTFEIK